MRCLLRELSRSSCSHLSHSTVVYILCLYCKIYFNSQRKSVGIQAETILILLVLALRVGLGLESV